MDLEEVCFIFSKFIVIKHVFRDKIDQINEYAADELKQFNDIISSLKPQHANCLDLFVKRFDQFNGRIERMAREAKLKMTQMAQEFDVDMVKLRIQSVYRAIEQNIDDKTKPIDRLRQALQAVKLINLNEVCILLICQC